MSGYHLEVEAPWFDVTRTGRNSAVIEFHLPDYPYPFQMNIELDRVGEMRRYSMPLVLKRVPNE